MKLLSRKQIGFTTMPLHSVSEPPAIFYIKQHASFWIASLSLVAFVAGNMLGQHGWHAFWKSVLGKSDDTLIVYTGTVPPVSLVPDYEKWYAYGGNPDEHTFREVPKDILVPLPFYDQRSQKKTDVDHWVGASMYGVSYMGDYRSGAEDTGSHPGVDIRIPVGTPVQSIANGIVDQIKENGGFGKVLVVRHPNVPDPSNPNTTTTLYAVYAHLNAIYVNVGDIVQKAQHVADSGNTGFTSGPHLHFQLDRMEAPWHPFWPFSDSEAAAAGLNFTQAIDQGLNKGRGYIYTAHPMLYVQANYPAPVSRTVVASADPTVNFAEPVHGSALTSSSSSSLDGRYVLKNLLSRAQERAKARAARQKLSVPSKPLVTQAPVAVPAPTPAVVVASQEVVSADPTVEIPFPPQKYSTESATYFVTIEHDGSYTGRNWEKVFIAVQDEHGNTIRSPELNTDIYLRAAFGEADFQPAVLSQLDFKNGVAEVLALPFGRRTLVIQTQPGGELSRPMRYEGE